MLERRVEKLSNRHGERCRSRARKRGNARRALFVMLGMTGMLGCSDTSPATKTPPSVPNPAVAEPKIAQLTTRQKAEDALRRGDVPAAEKELRSLLISRPNEVSTQLLSAKVSAAKHDYQHALATIFAVTKNGDASAEEVVSAYEIIGEIALVSVDSLSSHQRLAWVGIESVLKTQPRNYALRKALIRLLNRMGHRHRACQHSDWLCVVGAVDQEHLFGVLARRDSFPSTDLTGESQADISEGKTVLAKARRYYTQHRFNDASEILRPLLGSGWPDAEHAALFGEVLAETQAFDSMPHWHDSCPVGVSQYAEYWSAMGLWYGSASDYRSAAGCFLKAIEIDPTHLNDYRQLSFCVRKLGGKQWEKLATRIGQTTQLVQDTFSQAGIANSKSVTTIQANDSSGGNVNGLQRAKYLSKMSQTLNALGRPTEFVAWQLLLSEMNGAPSAQIAKLRQQQQRLARIPDLKQMTIEDRRMGLNVSDYPSPTSEQIRQWVASAERSEPDNELPGLAKTEVANASFRDVSGSLGLSFRYQNHSSPKEIGFRIHESMGGGIAVLDFDLDGNADLYFNQGGGDPPATLSSLSNEFYRNLGTRFHEVQQSSQTTDYGYSTGVAAGDVNQDGFPDLYIGALGRNRLLVNQGDGTFKETKYRSANTFARYTASIAIADVTGDQLPDLIETNYVGGDRIEVGNPIFDERSVAEGQLPAGTSPRDYAPAGDRVFVCLPNGTFSESNLESDGFDAAASLGLIVADLNDRVGNEIFIANDAYPNRYWVRNDQDTFVDQAAAFGLAVDYSRTETAGMGVAAGDFDSNGKIDLHVTNFWEQSSTLYMQQPGGLFLDQAPRYGLESLTYALLGFGTQAADFDLNGKTDLAILNGHIEDYRVIGHPFRMKPQLLLGSEAGFQAAVNRSSEFFQKPQLGRSLATLDWNSDGKLDLVAGDLDAPVALLQNTTDSENSWCQLRLVGTASARDAVGAKIEIRTKDQSWVDWVIAGNGYQCSNERVVTIGLGSADQIDHASVRWPSGKTQMLAGLIVNKSYIAIEDVGVFLLDSK